MLTERQIRQLKAAARPRYIDGKDNPKFGTDNPILDEVIAQIKEDNPRAFLTPDELPLRHFFHKPKVNDKAKYQVLHASYVTPDLSDRI
jgi:hypothetical protein